MNTAEVIAAFGAAWNAGDDVERLDLLAQCCLPDAVFVAPQGQVSGIDAMSASIGECRRAFPLPMSRSAFLTGTANSHACPGSPAGTMAGPIWLARTSPSPALPGR